MKYLLFCISLFLVLGCTNNVSDKDISLLNGYWEIAEVEFNDGQKKKYTVNPTIDYIQVKGLKGFKKKVHPKFNGSYDTSDDAEAFTLIKKDGSFIFSYKNSLSQWEEKLVQLKEDTFSVTNQDKITYTYKRYKPLNIK
ncbi:hypothetical protein [uncultured Croceitalea sp.]|uniref:hypothetical protein n=1 Tax=uncultured Croceitalea sp. TaxID=1798908 RepID=UPI00374E619E